MALKALLVAQDRQFADRFTKALGSHTKGCGKIHYSDNIDTALYLASHRLPEAIFIDEEFGESDINRFISELRREMPHSVHIMMTNGRGRSALRKALKVGARDYLVKDELCPTEFDRCLWGLYVGAVSRYAAKQSQAVRSPSVLLDY